MPKSTFLHGSRGHYEHCLLDPQALSDDLHGKWQAALGRRINSFANNQELNMPAMKFSTIVFGSVFILTSHSALADTQEIPNLVGTWSGSIVGGARFGELNHDPAQKEPVFADRMKVWTLAIEQQDGTGLIGTWSSERKTEKVVGVIRQDNVTVLLADEDNVFDARVVSADELELCALEASSATIAVCYRMKRD